MKQKITTTIDEETAAALDAIIAAGTTEADTIADAVIDFCREAYYATTGESRASA